eukprot:TRINITY_DN8526_c0_g2_i12.p1 TRINITY_DN8526_c0_g2~~TRINITY_DN8526_c0_g2_i12.p1  ORF type:complete len:109 (+),score=12.25 TRINITY_DN8526_c0_g2_i12:1750-2076(+)
MSPKPLKYIFFWKLDFLINIFSCFIELIRGLENHVFSPASLVSCGTHLHSLYKENTTFTFPFLLLIFIVEGLLHPTLGFSLLLLASPSPINYNSCQMENGASSFSSPS